MITSRSLAAVLLLSSALIAPDIAAAAGEESPSPPPQTQTAPSHSMKKGTHTKKKDTMQRNGSAEDFLDGYHAAWALIYDKGDYAAGMAALHALGYDDNADVATLLGYASRKLGRYDEAKFWYERALAADPEPRSDLVLLRHVAGRAGQFAQGQRRSRKGAGDLRQHRLPALPDAQRRYRRHGDVLTRRRYEQRRGNPVAQWLWVASWLSLTGYPLPSSPPTIQA